MRQLLQNGKFVLGLLQELHIFRLIDIHHLQGIGAAVFRTTDLQDRTVRSGTQIGLNRKLANLHDHSHQLKPGSTGRTVRRWFAYTFLTGRAPLNPTPCPPFLLEILAPGVRKCRL